MSDSILQLDPRPVWEIFAGMSAVPRPSKREEKIRAHFHALAERHGFTSRQDAVGNIVIEVPATPGHESAPTVVLQGHLDMVCEKNAGVVHDFDNDPIRLQLTKVNDTQFVTADGTTLGADNGIGVSLATAAATSDEVTHGPLELLLTTDEEQGMTGAMALTPESFKGRTLINLDADDALYIGCAGGCDTDMRWRFPRAARAAAAPLEVRVLGLRGGHSGVDIHENRGNAIQILARVLARAAGATPLQLATIGGGNLRNAIPREATAVVSGDRAALESAASAVAEACRRDSLEVDTEITVAPAASPPDAWLAPDASRTLIDTLVALPSGVISMHPEIPTLVQNSNNLSVLKTSIDGETATIHAQCLSRSASESLLDLDKEKLAALGRTSGATVEHSNQYPGWDPNVDSKLLATGKRVFREVRGFEAPVKAVHAGLECGLIGDCVGGDIDMLAFGPEITGAHSPDERVSVASVARTWEFLKALLAELA